MTARPSERADTLLVQRGLVASRARAQALIREGVVIADGRPVSKPGEKLAPDADLQLTAEDHPYVSRGGLKLAHALEHFDLDPAGLTALDIGASTGGFTDVLLKAGTHRVYAVDVGHGQLAEKLVADARVVSLEGRNAKDLTISLFPEPVEAIVCDVSFISLEKALPAALALAAPGAWLVALIKPQFEAGRGHVGSGGVVRDPAVHEAVCTRIVDWLNGLNGWSVIGVTPSPVEGPAGNREFLVAARYGPA